MSNEWYKNRKRLVHEEMDTFYRINHKVRSLLVNTLKSDENDVENHPTTK